MTVGLVVVSHSAQLAAGVAEVAGQMAQGKVRIAAAGGGIDDVLGTSADKILAAIQSVDGPDGVLVLLDLGGAILSAETALEMLSDQQRAHTRLSYAPLVEGAVAAAIAASIGHSLAQVQQAAEETAGVEQFRKLKPVATNGQPAEVSAAVPTVPEEQAEAEEIQLLLTNPAGLHARPAGLFVQTAARFRSSIQVMAHGKQADAKGMMGVLSLGARQGDTITLRVSGPDAAEALAALRELVEAGFYETQAEVAPPPTTPAVAPATPAPTATTANTWRGVSTSNGVALGPALLYTSHIQTLRTFEPRTIAPEQVAAEQNRLRLALAAASQELHELAESLQDKLGRADADIFNAQALMVDDPEVLDAALRRIAEDHLDAASALALTGEEYAATLESLDNPLLAARGVDMRDAVSRAIDHLGERKTPRQDLGSLTSPVILIARDLTPSDTARLRPEFVLGICTVTGGPNAHAAIIARALGIPAMAGLSEAALRIIQDGDEVGLDAAAGLLYYRPTQQVRTDLLQRIDEQRRQRALIQSIARQARTPVKINGRRIHLLANVGSEAEAQAARQWGAEGIGLLRTEFLFARATTLPNEDEQRQMYVEVFRAFVGEAPAQAGPLVVRTLDAGADKPMPALNTILGSAPEANPALGLRGIRIHLAHRELLEQQLSALLLAAADTGAKLHIMFPMISTVEELLAARSVFDRVYARLKGKNVPIPAHVPVGIMVEVPAAVAMAPELATYADFFSIGANDLLQYTLASDRTNASVAGLYQPMQPALLRLIAQVAEAARRAGKPVAVCGEMASDTRLAPVLVALGIDELSMNPSSIPSVREALSRRSARQLSKLAKRLRYAKTVAEVEQICAEQ